MFLPILYHSNGLKAIVNSSYKSSIFTTVKNDLTSTISGVSTFGDKIGVLNVSFKDLKRTLSSTNENGLFFTKKQLLGNLFANTDATTITRMDVAMINDYNKAIDDGVDSGIAFENTMFGASRGARELAYSANGGKISLEGVTISQNNFRLSTIGATVAQTAFNTALTMGIGLAIQFAIQGLSYLIHYQEKQIEAAEEQAQKSQEVADKAAFSFGLAFAIQGLITLFQKLKDAIPTVENTAKSLKDSADKVKEIKNKLEGLNDELTTTQKQIVKGINETSSYWHRTKTEKAAQSSRFLLNYAVSLAPPTGLEPVTS